MTRTATPKAALRRPSLPIGLALSPLETTVRSLWTSLLSKDPSASSARRLAFVSAHSGEGTTTIARCAAFGIARHAKLDVVLIESHAAGPGLAAEFDLENLPTVRDALEERVSLRDALVDTDVPRLKVLDLGGLGAAGISSEKWEELLCGLEEQADHVLMAAAPFLDRPEERPLLQPFERSVAVVRAWSTRKPQVQKLVQGLARLGVVPVGTVLNRHRRSGFLGLSGSFPFLG